MTIEEIFPNLKKKKGYKVGRSMKEILEECREERDNPPPVQPTHIVKMPHQIFKQKLDAKMEQMENFNQVKMEQMEVNQVNQKKVPKRSISEECFLLIEIIFVVISV